MPTMHVCADSCKIRSLVYKKKLGDSYGTANRETVRYVLLRISVELPSSPGDVKRSHDRI